MALFTGKDASEIDDNVAKEISNLWKYILRRDAGAHGRRSSAADQYGFGGAEAAAWSPG
jgi:hypothetical protein